MTRKTSLRTVLLFIALTGSAWWSMGLVAQPPEAELNRRIASTIREMGEVESAAAVELRCEIPGQTSILWVAPEGSSVKTGDVLVQLDGSAIKQKIAEQRIITHQARAELAGAMTRVESLELRRQGTKKLSQLQNKAAELEHSALLGEGGELDQKLQQTKSEITVCKARIAAVNAKVAAWQAGDLKELPADLALMRVEAQEQLAVATRRLDYIDRVLRESEAASFALERTRMELELNEEQADVEQKLATAKSVLAGSEESFEQASSQLDRLTAALEKCVIKAPQAGTVVYANQLSSRGAAGFIVEPGATVRERQPLIRLPDLTKLNVSTLVNETRISTVRVGQTATIRIDALPDQPIQGVVRRVANTPQPSSFLQGNLKSYVVTVEMLEVPQFVRLGMTAMVEIDTKQKPAARNPR